MKLSELLNTKAPKTQAEVKEDILKIQRDALVAGTSVNPPESVKVLEEQTVPEIDGKAEPEPAPKARARKATKKKSTPRKKVPSDIPTPNDPFWDMTLRELYARTKS